MTLFEKSYIFDNTIPVIIVDLRVSLWRLLYAIKINEELWDYDDLKVFWEIKFNSLLDSHPFQKFQIIVVDDFKYKSGNYWRDSYLKKADGDFPTYKGNRKPEERPELYHTLHKAALDYIKEQGYAYFSKRGFEADDFAGAICSIINQKQGIKRPVFLYTVDSDWGQLVNDNNQIIFYYCALPCWKHKMRDEAIIKEWFQEKQGICLSEVRDIVEFKTKEGDKSDNLIPGSPREVIDLLNPGKKLPKKILQELEKELMAPKIHNNPILSIKGKILTSNKLYDHIISSNNKTIN